MVLVYLVEAKGPAPITWVSREKDLKGGSTFFQGLPRFPICGDKDRYGRDPEAFLRLGRLSEARSCMPIKDSPSKCFESLWRFFRG
jgi:hypothetical protein